jgi:high-affinity Fe2+/Pb2+ permease
MSILEIILLSVFGGVILGVLIAWFIFEWAIRRALKDFQNI